MKETDRKPQRAKALRSGVAALSCGSSSLIVVQIHASPRYPSPRPAPFDDPLVSPRGDENNPSFDLGVGCNSSQMREVVPNGSSAHMIDKQVKSVI